MQGTLLWFNDVKGHGFISTEEGERLLVEGNGFAEGAKPEGRCAGLPVVFEVTEEDGLRKAEGVSVVEHVAPRRARRRTR